MLNAILHGKKRGSGTQGESLETTFSGAEDTLTSTVFERLFYLSDELISEILMSEEWWGSNVPVGAIEDIFFWPRWESALTDGQKEPDVVVLWKERILVIEAKRNDFVRLQCPQQLAHECASARKRYPDRAVFILAVGGLEDKRPQTINNLYESTLKHLTDNRSTTEFKFFATTWYDLAKKIEDVLNNEFHRPLCLKRMLSDIFEGMRLHGISVAPPSWLIELTEKEWLTTREINLDNFYAFVNSTDVLVKTTSLITGYSLSQVGILTQPDFFIRR